LPRQPVCLDVLRRAGATAGELLIALSSGPSRSGPNRDSRGVRIARCSSTRIVARSLSVGSRTVPAGQPGRSRSGRGTALETPSQGPAGTVPPDNDQTHEADEEQQGARGFRYRGRVLRGEADRKAGAFTRVGRVAPHEDIARVRVVEDESRVGRLGIQER